MIESELFSFVQSCISEGKSPREVVIMIANEWRSQLHDEVREVGKEFDKLLESKIT